MRRVAADNDLVGGRAVETGIDSDVLAGNIVTAHQRAGSFDINAVAGLAGDRIAADGYVRGSRAHADAETDLAMQPVVDNTGMVFGKPHDDAVTVVAVDVAVPTPHPAPP